MFHPQFLRVGGTSPDTSLGGQTTNYRQLGGSSPILCMNEQHQPTKQNLFSWLMSMDTVPGIRRIWSMYRPDYLTGMIVIILYKTPYRSHFLCAADTYRSTCVLLVPDVEIKSLFLDGIGWNRNASSVKVFFSSSYKITSSILLPGLQLMCVLN